MKGSRHVMTVCIASTCALTLMVLFLTFFFMPHRSWPLFDRFMILVVVTEICAATLGYGIGRHAVATLGSEAEADQARLRLFLSETGHELRTPLTVMRASLDLIRPSLPVADVAAQTILDGLAQEVNRLIDLVQQVLLLARLDVVHAVASRRIDLPTLIETLAAEARARAPATAIGVDCAGVLSIAGDEVGLREAIRNLLDNALRHAPGAAIEIRARSEYDTVRVSVTDHGPGMDAENSALAFERYYRGSNASHDDGVGLGLAIVRAFAERSGGQASLTSNPNRGTCVTLRLPGIAGERESGGRRQGGLAE